MMKRLRYQLPLLVILLILSGLPVSASSPTQEPLTPTAGKAPANGLMIAYESFGPTDGETILLIGGTGMQLVDWPMELVEALVQQGYRVVRFDNRDIGLSTKLTEAGLPDAEAIGKALEAGEPAPLPYTLQDMAKDAVGLLDALDIQQAHLAGISMGGAIAQLVAIDYPERVLSLTSLMADSGNPELPVIARPEAFEGVPPQPTTVDREAFIEWQVKTWQALSGPEYPTAEATLREWAARNFERGFDPAGLTRQQTVSFVGHIESAGYRLNNLQNIKAPTVVLQGTEDPLVPVASAEDLVARIPGAELRLIPGLGHDIPVELVPEFVEAITAAANRATSATAAAQALTPRDALEKLLTAETPDPSWFAETFLAQFPAEQIEGLLVQLNEQFGSFEQIEGEASPFTVVFAQGTSQTEIALDPEGRITTLHFYALTPEVGSLEEAVALFQELPGAVSVYVQKDGEEIGALNAEEPLAVGSAFKLAVLATLQDQIEGGEHTWEEVVALEPEWKGLPYSQLKDWPDGSPLTLQTLATLMISVSDNTATDGLIDIVGREAIETYTPNSRPLLTTLETFKLKAPENAELLERYLNGEEAEKRQVVQALSEAPVPDLHTMPTGPSLEAEWYFTTQELCQLMAQVEALPLMAVEPGPGAANPAAWAHVAFKGGSEPGVLNLTTWLETDEGAQYCFSATQNVEEGAIDEEGFSSLYRAVVETGTQN